MASRVTTQRRGTSTRTYEPRSSSVTLSLSLRIAAITAAPIAPVSMTGPTVSRLRTSAMRGLVDLLRDVDAIERAEPCGLHRERRIERAAAGVDASPRRRLHAHRRGLLQHAGDIRHRLMIVDEHDHADGVAAQESVERHEHQATSF